MTHINQRRDTEAQWAFENPVLHQGELGWESDTRQAKLGDGVTPWLAAPPEIGGSWRAVERVVAPARAP